MKVLVTAPSAQSPQAVQIVVDRNIQFHKTLKLSSNEQHRLQRLDAIS
jgi:hypothetical protein